MKEEKLNAGVLVAQGRDARSFRADSPRQATSRCVLATTSAYWTAPQHLRALPDPACRLGRGRRFLDRLGASQGERSHVGKETVDEVELAPLHPDIAFWGRWR